MNTRLSKRQLESGLGLLLRQISKNVILSNFMCVRIPRSSKLYHKSFKCHLTVKTNLSHLTENVFVIRDAKNMFQENRESNMRAFQPTQSYCLLCYTLVHLSLFWHKRDSVSVSLTLWLLDATALDRIGEFNMLICAEANLYCFWSSTPWPMYFMCLCACTYCGICPVGFSYFFRFCVFRVFFITCCIFMALWVALICIPTVNWLIVNLESKVYILQQHTSSDAPVKC